MPIQIQAIDNGHPDTVAVVRGPLVLFPITKNAPVIKRQQLLSAVRIPSMSGWQAGTAADLLLLLSFTAIENQPYTTYLTVSSL